MKPIRTWVRKKRQRILGLAVLLLLLPATTCADTITIFASRDTSLYQDLPGNSDGAGPGMVVGNTDKGRASPRRALLDFDVAASVPAGATITGAQFTLVMEQAAPADSRARAVELHRLLANWGEGTTGQGTPAARSGQGFPAPTDGTTATWSHRFFNTTPWTNPGGDFDAAASGSAMVGTARQGYVWNSTTAMVHDVQSWLDDPASNFGWLLLGDESAAATARRFDTREATNSSLRPALQITYSAAPVPEPATLTLLALGTLGGISFLWRRRPQKDEG
jgi:hypothetical protein